MTPEEVLYKYWRYTQFRPLQKEIIQSVLDGQDTLALMPTGGGKSLCFQVPALIFPGITLVITPLISLMKDQVSRLVSLGIQAEYIAGGMSLKDVERIKSNCQTGKIKLLYVSPERLKSTQFITFLHTLNVSMLVVDEAHCISQWGYDFRPSYLDISAVKELFPSIVTLALTASATPMVQEDLIGHLDMKSVRVFRQSFLRPNLVYGVRLVEDKRLHLINFIKKIKGTGIVYLRTRRKTTDIALFLNQNNISAEAYHAGLKQADLQAIQNRWMKGQTRVLAATTAFGMGIDKPDVRFVIHLDVPPSLEEYYQEAGRAGRDGEKAFAVLYYGETDMSEVMESILESFPSENVLKYVYDRMAKYYQVGNGPHDVVFHDFDLWAFSKEINCEMKEVFYAIKELERQNLITVTDGMYNPHRVMINYTKNELYDFQLRYPKYDHLLEALLRLYGGIMHMPVQIAIKMLAERINLDVQTVTIYLNDLHKAGVIDYFPQKEGSMISFGNFRYAEDDLKIDMSLQNFLKKNRIEKAEAMQLYINETICRNIHLAEYFGENLADRCEICDLCVQFRNTNREEMRWKQCVDFILDFATKPNNTILALQKTEMFMDNKEMMQSVLNFLSDEGIILIDQFKISKIDV